MSRDTEKHESPMEECPQVPPLFFLSIPVDMHTTQSDMSPDIEKNECLSSGVGGLAINHYNPSKDLSGVNEAKLVRKVDWHLLPWLSFLYLLTFLDRTSIGNAKVR